jgi:hypothetical protein
VAQAINQKRFQTALQMIEHQSSFGVASSNVIATLGKMKRELG